VGALDKLEGFCATHGAAFYDLPYAAPPGTRTAPVVLRRRPTPVPASFPFGAAGVELVPLRAGETVAWAVSEV
jgi:dihydroorotase